jgi:hypothetical protein
MREPNGNGEFKEQTNLIGKYFSHSAAKFNNPMSIFDKSR